MRKYLLVIALGAGVSVLLPNSCAIGTGDGLVLAFSGVVFAIALVLFAVRPKGGHNWPPRCAPTAAPARGEAEREKREAA